MKEKAESPKHRRILEAAQKLFFKHGIKRVTIQEICGTADVSKMTFYKYFRDKTDLSIALIDVLFAARARTFKEAMELDIPFPEKMKRLVEARLADSGGVGREFLAETYRSSEPEVRDFIKRKVDETAGMAMTYYVQAQKNGDVRPDIKPEFLMWLFGHVSDWMGDERLLGMHGSTRDLAAEIINFFLYGIMARKEKE